MAVTQQLARVSAQYLATCRTSAATSPDGDHRWDPPAVDVLDLDWAPYLLERIGELAGLDDARRHALRRSMNGDTAIDLGFLNRPPHDIAPFGLPPTAFTPEQVTDLAQLLARIDMAALLSELPADETEAGRAIGNGADRTIGGPRKYVLDLARRAHSRTSTEIHARIGLRPFPQ